MKFEFLISGSKIDLSRLQDALPSRVEGLARAGIIHGGLMINFHVH